MKIFADGICPVCGSHMSGTNTESMKCPSCGCEEAICREDIEAIMKAFEKFKCERGGENDA